MLCKDILAEYKEWRHSLGMEWDEFWALVAQPQIFSLRVTDRGFQISGREVEEFSVEIYEYQGTIFAVRRAFGISSSSMIHLLYQAQAIRFYDRVIDYLIKPH